MYVVKKRTLFEPTFASTQLGFWQKLYNAARMTDGRNVMVREFFRLVSMFLFNFLFKMNLFSDV